MNAAIEYPDSTAGYPYLRQKTSIR